MPKSLEEAEKRKCEKEDCTIFMGIYFREYREMDSFLFCDNAHCHNGRVIWLLERYLPQQRLCISSIWNKNTTFYPEQNSHSSSLRTENFLGLQVPMKPSTTDVFFFPNRDKDPLIEKPLFLFSWWVDGRSYNYLVSLNCYW